MKVIRHSAALKAALSKARKKHRSIGFVPTMGYLHEGHLSLVRRAKAENDVVVASIFVNPLQFGPKEDFVRYPKNFNRDRTLLAREGVDFLFVPAVKGIYPEGFQTSVTVDKLSLPLCGRSRPTHFKGVATVVLKLLNLTAPDVVYLGQKDYQQCRVLERMVEDLGLPVKVKKMSIVREQDGLAMSSRNVRLSPEERAQAPFIYQSLRRVRARIRAGERRTIKIKQEWLKMIKKASLGRLDYAEIVDADTLENMVKLLPGRRVVAAVAVRFKKARLIDNLLIKV